MADQNVIEFMSADEVHRLAELEKESDRQRTVAGMVDHFNEVYMELGGTQFLMSWAQEEPGEFIKLMAKLKLSDKEKKSVTRIIIGLPTTELDD